MGRAKTIKLYLKDGDPSGIIKCTLTNWTGVAYKVPRTACERCKNIELLQQSGVYFLFGKNKNDDDMVYVGQAGYRKNGKGLLNRVLEPHDSIEWTEAIMFTRTDNTLGPTEISYLENRFCNIAIEMGRYEVKNGNEPSSGHVTEEIESELEEFIEYARIVVGVLGHNVFEPILATQQEEIDSEPTLYMDYKNITASGKRTAEGFVVFKGSRINPTMTKSCPEGVQKARKKYRNKIGENNTLLSDVLLSSPSAAAGFVGGASLSGNALWHDVNKVPLKKLLELEEV